VLSHYQSPKNSQVPGSRLKEKMMVCADDFATSTS
jgi:hypothetical protein